MPATRIQYDIEVTGTFTALATLTSIAVGDLIVVGCGNGSAPDVSGQWVVTDDIGTNYLGGYWDDQQFSNANAFYGTATTSGTCTITAMKLLGATGSQFIAAANYRGAGAFDQHTRSIGGFIGTALSTIGSGPVTLADTLIVSFAYCQTSGVNLNSMSGDTLFAAKFNGVESFFAYERMATGPGNTTVIIEGTNANLNTNECPLITLTFSTPLSRPLGVTYQSNVRSGPGSGSEVLNPPEFNIKNPITACLPYTPVLGSLVVITCSYSNTTTPTFGVSDTYGNSYTPLIVSPGLSSNTWIAAFYTVLTALPPTGEVFNATATFTFTPAGNVYQSTSIGIFEQLLGGNTPVVQAAGYLLETPSNPSLTLQSDVLTVDAGDSLYGYSVYAGQITQQDITWTPLESYTIDEQYNFIQFLNAGVNGARCSTIALSTKTATASGTYDVQTEGTINGNFVESGAIILIAVGTAASIGLQCPISITATIGVPYTGTVTTSGGVPPFTFTIIS